MASTLRQRRNANGAADDGTKGGTAFAASISQPSQEHTSERASGLRKSETLVPMDGGSAAVDETAIPTADEPTEAPKHVSAIQDANHPTARPQAFPHSSSSVDTEQLRDGGSKQGAARGEAQLQAEAEAEASAGETTRGPMTGKQVAKDEARIKKVITRWVSGLVMISCFIGCLAMGHVYVGLMVVLAQVALFRELVKVRYHAHYATISGGTIPLFRTLQWMWFCVAIAYTYGDFVAEIIQHNPQLHGYLNMAHYATILSFALYSGTFVLTIATMQVGHIKFQLNQLCWTIVVLCLTVGQLKYIMHNIFNGLYWFALPIMLVVTNDCMAYICGRTCGRKFIHRPFIAFSPNKTWEGFIGSGIFTIMFSWYLSRHLAQYKLMTCPCNEFRLIPRPMECEPHHVFQPSQSILPQQIFEVFPPSLVKLIPGIVEFCSVKAGQSQFPLGSKLELEITRCISGEESHSFHHFELVLKNVYPVQIHALWLALFASLVAPFGGFLASAIKRAYGIKDFDSIIPGHGGLMDRVDCQFLMALCTWVHYNTFVKLATVSVPKLIYMYSLLSQPEQSQFLVDLVKAEGDVLNATQIQQLLNVLKKQLH